MYIIAIAWLYVTLLMAATEHSITAGVLTFVFYGLLPCGLLIWLFGTPQRRRNKLKASEEASTGTELTEVTEQPLGETDGANTKAD